MTRKMMGRKKRDEGRRFELVSQAAAASCLVLERFSVTLLDRKVNEVSSGTIVSLGKHLFIATAGHAIPNNPTGRLWLVRRQGRFEKDGFPGFLKWRRHTDPRLDVGYLEVERKTVADYLSHEDFCTMDNIADQAYGRKNRGTIIVGTPAQKLQKQVRGKTVILRFEVMPYWTPAMMPKEWPTVGKNDPPPDRRIDVFLDYPDLESRDFKTNKPSKLPSPDGMSGGGVWDQGFGLRPIWNPRDCKLYAIQSSWHKNQRYLRAVQIRHWIDLIRNDYPDLAGLFASNGFAPITR